MPFRTTFFIVLLFPFVLTSLVAQEKNIIIQKSMHGNDSTSLKHVVIIDRDRADSTREQVFLHKMPNHHQEAARIVIKKSGFFKKNKIVIDFDPVTKNIVSVIDNGKDMPEKKFHKYQEYLEDATEIAPMRALHPAMEEMDLKIELGDFPNSEELEGLDSLIIQLEALKSAHAVLKKEQYKLVKHVVELDNLAETIQNILAENGATPPQKIETIAIKKGMFYVNGKEIKGAAGEKCIQAYVEQTDLTKEDLDKNGDDISITIRFD
jgi:hypothetical protein